MKKVERKADSMVAWWGEKMVVKMAGLMVGLMVVKMVVKMVDLMEIQ